MAGCHTTAGGIFVKGNKSVANLVFNVFGLNALNDLIGLNFLSVWQPQLP
jgi:hypothetical protein